jgi:hypothetical protein
MDFLHSRKADVITRYVDVVQMIHKVRLRYHRIVRLLSQNMLLGLIPYVRGDKRRKNHHLASTKASVLCHRLFEIVLHERLTYKRKAPPIALAPG